MRRYGLLALCCVLAALPAHAEVGDATAGGFTVENTRVVAATPATAWKALVEQVDQWWPKGHSWWARNRA